MIKSDSIVEHTETFTVVFILNINGATYSGDNDITIYIEDSSGMCMCVCELVIMSITKIVFSYSNGYHNNTN